MRKPSELVMEQYFQKNGYVRLRAVFQVKGVGKGGYQGLRGQAKTIKCLSPSDLWTTINMVKNLMKSRDREAL